MATFREVALDIKRSFDRLTDPNAMYRFVGIGLHSLTLDRIFVGGGKSDGGQIGTYKPATVKIKKLKKRFSSSRINLEDTGQLRSDYIVSGIDGGFEIGFALTKRTDSKASNKDIRQYHEERFGNIFDLTADEESKVDTLIDEWIDKSIT